MKKTFLAILFCFTALTISVQAQNNSRLADRLASQTSDLYNRVYNDFRGQRNPSRSDVEMVFLARQMQSSAELYQQLVRDNRSASELREAAGILSDLSRRAPGYGSNGYLWREAQSTIRDIQQAVGGNGGGGGWGNDNRPPQQDRPNRPVSGRVSWRGRVDIETQLVIRGGELEMRNISGTPQRSGTYNFTSSLPNRNVRVEVDMKKGRGSVNVIQQPTRNNDFTAVIQILDRNSGAADYELDIYWQ